MEAFLGRFSIFGFELDGRLWNCYVPVGQEQVLPRQRGSMGQAKGQARAAGLGDTVPTSVLSKMGRHDNYRAGEMLHGEEAPDTKPDELSPIPGTHTVGGENQLIQVGLWLPHMQTYTLVSTHCSFLL